MTATSVEEEGKAIAKELGVTYNGPQYAKDEFKFHVFTDPLTGGTFAAVNKAGAWERFFRLRLDFGAPIPEDFPPALKGVVYKELQKLGLVGSNPCREARDALAKYEADVKAGHTEAAQYWKGQAEVYGLLCAESQGLKNPEDGDPRKFCCHQCGECAPPELLEEGKFPERIAWLRRHYKEKHPGLWGHVTEEEIQMAKPRTESERKSWHERIFGASSEVPGERKGLGQTTNALLPMSPESGPPLPRMLGIRWPWSKK